MSEIESKTKIKSNANKPAFGQEREETERSRRHGSGQGQGQGRGSVVVGDVNNKGNKVNPVVIVDLSDQVEARTNGDSNSTYVAMEIDEDPIPSPPHPSSSSSLNSLTGRTFLATEEGSMYKNLSSKRSSGIENTVESNKEEVEIDRKNNNSISNISKSSNDIQSKNILRKDQNTNLTQISLNGKNQPENIPQLRQPGNVPDDSGSPADNKLREKEKYKHRKDKEKGKEIMNEKENKNEIEEKTKRRKDDEIADKNTKIMKDYKREYENMKKTKIENQEKEKLFHAESFRKEGENLDL